MTPRATPTERVIGLFAATTIGVAAIIGGGVLALAGAAFVSAGPSATLAVALIGVVALITAASFAELATAFPESGGAYVFANRVLSIRAAFGVGWVLWFAYIVASVLYALGFAAFAALMLEDLVALAGADPPSWLRSHTVMVVLAGAATAWFTVGLVRHAPGKKDWISIAKVGIFAVLIVGGVVALALHHPATPMADRLTPFFAGGVPGLVHAMGLTFVIIHGFEVIAAVGGEVKDPRTVIPRAMFLSIAISLAVYVPLLFVAVAAGVPDGVSLGTFAARHGDTVIAAAVREYMGPVGYWLVIAVAILAFLSALRANLMAGSRIALSMARDRTLPPVLAQVDPRRRTPAMAVYATTAATLVVLLVVPDLEAAGASASLIFLLSFALTHVTAYLARKRAEPGAAVFRTPLFPLIPALGFASCLGLAGFEALAVPDAGRIAMMWLAFGVILYFALFKTHAETADASAEALDPSRGRMRGKDPLILVPIASPANAPALVEVAHTLAPSGYGRVLLLTVVPAPHGPSDAAAAHLETSQKVVAEALGASFAAGFAPEALISPSDDAWGQIRHVARFHDCDSLLLGLGHLPSSAGTLSPELETLVDDVDCDVAILRAPRGWHLADARRVVVPVAGKGEEHKLRARVLGSICRTGERDIHFVTVVPANTTDAECADVRAHLERLAHSHVQGSVTLEVLRDDDPVSALRAAVSGADLVVLGLGSTGGRRKVTSRVSLAIAGETACATLLLSGKRPLAYGDLYRPLRGVLDALGGEATHGDPGHRAERP